MTQQAIAQTGTQSDIRHTLPELPDTSRPASNDSTRFAKSPETFRKKGVVAARNNAAQAAVFRFDNGEYLTRAQIADRYQLNESKVSRVVAKLRKQGLRVFPLEVFQQAAANA